MTVIVSQNPSVMYLNFAESSPVQVEHSSGLVLQPQSEHPAQTRFIRHSLNRRRRLRDTAAGAHRGQRLKLGHRGYPPTAVGVVFAGPTEPGILRASTTGQLVANNRRASSATFAHGR